MKVYGIGINSSTMGYVNELKQLEQNLDDLVRIGYRVVELGIEQQNLLINGEIKFPEFNNLKSVLNNFPITYTVHGYVRLNLAYDERIELCRKVMNAQLEFCKGIGASRLVIHSGLESLTTIRQKVRDTLLSDDELLFGKKNEVDALKAAGKLASDAGVDICVENGDPHLWEINLITQSGGRPSDLAKYHQRLVLQNIVNQLEEVNLPNVVMTLDVGHLFIAAKILGFDYLSAIRSAAPWIKHLHISDNFGNLDRNVYNEPDRWAFGEADMHMPPGWGCIPLEQAINCLPDFEGYAILEINEGFRGNLKDALATANGLFKLS